MFNITASSLMDDRNPSIETDCAKLARSAEWWGAGPQGECLAKIARYLSVGNVEGAMRLRDEMRGARDDARSEVIGAIIERLRDGFQEAFPLLISLLIPLTFWLIKVLVAH